MRKEIVLVAAVLLVGAALFTMWPILSAALTGSVPGQYPIGAARWEWPMTERVAPYYPGSKMGSDAVKFTDGADEKVRCATSPTCD
jgi:hypothetical protein